MKPFQKALFSGVSALLVSLPAAQAAEALGTINIVQLSVQVRTLKPSTETSTVGGQLTDRTDALITRLAGRSVIEALATAEGSGFPANTPVKGWNLVEVFDDQGGEQGFFAYKAGFAPIPLTDDFFSILFPADSASFVTSLSVTANDNGGNVLTKDNHYVTSDITGTIVAPAVSGGAVAFNGTALSTTSVRNIGPHAAPLSHYVVARKGSISGNTAVSSITGTFISTGTSALVSIQAFEDAAGTTPATTSK